MGEKRSLAERAAEAMGWHVDHGSIYIDPVTIRDRWDPEHDANDAIELADAICGARGWEWGTGRDGQGRAFGDVDTNASSYDFGEADWSPAKALTITVLSALETTDGDS